MIDINSGEFISLSEAQTLTQDFKNHYPNRTKAYFVGKNKVNLVLDQQEAIGIRFYSGYDSQNHDTNIVLVGVKADERDMTDGVIVDKAQICPDRCDTNSALYF